MSTFSVIRKSDGVEVTRYAASAVTEIEGFEFATHDHIELNDEVAPAEIPSDWYIDIGSFFDRFGANKMPILASTDPVVQAIIFDASVRKYLDLLGRRSEINLAVDTLIAKGFDLDKALIVNTKPSAHEVYRGQ